MIPILFVGSDVAMLILRLALGAVFIAHGWDKIKNLPSKAMWFESVGFKPGRIWATTAGILEFGGGILFVAGFFVQPIAVLLALQFLVILMWRCKRREKLMGGYEFDLVILASLVVLATIGSDFYALDYFVGPLF